MKHLNISPKDWELSSFKKFVKQGLYQEDWCNFDDKCKITVGLIVYNRQFDYLGKSILNFNSK